MSGSKCMKYWGPCPIYNTKAGGLSVKDIISICIGGNVDPSRVCTTVPSGVNKNVVFVIDLSNINPKDMACDDNGVYGRHSSPSEKVKIFYAKNGSIGRHETITNADSKTDGHDVFLIRRQYSWHTTWLQLRVIVRVQSEDGAVCKYAILQFKAKKGSEDIHIRPHGNAKCATNEPYHRTPPSVIGKIRELSQNTPKHIITEIEHQAGDILNIDDPLRQVPKNRSQVYNAVKSVPGRIKSRSTGPSKTPEFTRLISMMTSDDFVKDVSFGVRHGGTRREVKPNTFAATDYQINWIKTFCSGTSPTSQAGIDMPFKMGPFYVTTMNCSNPMFVYRTHPGRHPTTQLAVMTSVFKEEEDYRYMADCLYTKAGVNTLTYGTDGETALEKGFEDRFPITESKNIHLRCFDHVQSDIRRKLKKINVGDREARNIAKEILGYEKEGRRIFGLVDASSEREFDEQLNLLEIKWPPEFRKWIHTNVGRVRPLVDTLKKCMLRPVRTAAGLGNPPNKWSNQRTEAMNNVMKEEAGNQVTDQVEVHNLLKTKVVDQQFSEYVKAIYGHGEYRLSQVYNHLVVEPTRWKTMGRAQQQDYVRKIPKIFHTATTISNPTEEVDRQELSVPMIDSGLLPHYPGYVLQELWKGARVILAKSKVVTLAEDNFCVPDYNTSYNVSRLANGDLSCGCQEFHNNRGLCKHVLVVAETDHKLKTFLEGIVKSRNGSKTVFTGRPSSAGKKPKQKKRRKGQNNAVEVPISEIEDHMPDLQSIITMITLFTLYSFLTTRKP